jgi:hypothetical protein
MNMYLNSKLTTQIRASEEVRLPISITKAIDCLGCGKSLKAQRHAARRLRKAVRWMSNKGYYARIVRFRGHYNPSRSVLTPQGVVVRCGETRSLYF